jgi:hypothetical protein
MAGIWGSGGSGKGEIASGDYRSWRAACKDGAQIENARFLEATAAWIILGRAVLAETRFPAFRPAP